jgi:hypothetical protein
MIDRIVNMIVNQLLRRGVNTAINAGIKRASGKGKPAGQMTQADHAQGSTAREAAKRARQAARITRRLGR